MTAEILLYALIAAGLIFWLRSVLGTRHGDERQRPNPFTQQTPPQNNPALGVVDGGDAAIAASQNPDALMDGPLYLPKNSRTTLADPALEAPLTELLRVDRGFTLAHFAQGAQDAFVMIVEAFAAKDRDLLKSLLSPDLYKAFETAMKEREENGQAMETEIHAIRHTEITEVRLQDKMVFITLRFVADETSVIRAADNTIISGHPDRVSETIDIWTFGRDTRSKDPTWFLFATREEEMGATSMPEAALT